jgi:genetic interactor of prohibitins 3, mitochondrial
MAQTLQRSCLRRTFGLNSLPHQISVSAYLCPAFSGILTASRPGRSGVRIQRRMQSQPTALARQTEQTLVSGVDLGLLAQEARSHEAEPAALKLDFKPGHGTSPATPLPAQCWGCGALSQTVEPGRAGYFNVNRKVVAAYLNPGSPQRRETQAEDDIVHRVLEKLDLGALAKSGVSLASLAPGQDKIEDTRPLTTAPSIPLCDRCHDLVHNQAGNSIYHPSVEALAQTIEQSPFKYNHVYHVLDAADFPMSLIPGLHRLLESVPLRSKNRRSKSHRFHSGHSTRVSFVISRSDLLAPRKEQVDKLVPKLKEILREALGKTARNVRLGDVWCVSAKRSWWTKELKEDVWRTGGAGWMVGKVNVGKSRLFEAIFPKGRMGDASSARSEPVESGLETEKPLSEEAPVPSKAMLPEDARHNTEVAEQTDAIYEAGDALLPPAREEIDYPEMPIVSALPGTTASPIRVPYGNGRGELIDLPGLERSHLESFVEPTLRSSLIMKARMIPVQQSLTPGKSLLLGGLVRITPRTPNLVFLCYNFTPLDAHLTSTGKAVALQTRSEHAPNVKVIATEAAAKNMRSAGVYQLRDDVTKARTGPVTRHDAVGLKIDRLPYRVLAIDILIEGCGWVEVVAQVRSRDLFKPKNPAQTRENQGEDPAADFLSMLSGPTPVSEPPPEPIMEPNWPEIEVFSPEGRFVGSRPSINGWIMNQPRQTAKNTRGRPRRSMRGAKKLAKITKRQAQGS